eukprot:3283418-Ditylum_brightwellii.AAC.1
MTSWLSNEYSKVADREHNNGQVFYKCYEQFISACDPTSNVKGEEQALPSTVQPISASNFGKPNLNHHFSSEQLDSLPPIVSSSSCLIAKTGANGFLIH